MADGADAYVDRRRLRRQVTLWRTLAALAAIVVIIIAAWRGEFAGGVGGSYVARLDVSGLIVSDAARDRAIDALARDPNVAALIVSIDSPGGTAAGSEALMRRLRALAVHRPVIAVMGEVAASGGYMTALGADRIIARPDTITASVGVIMQSAEVSRLLDRLGITIDTIRSGERKATPSPLEPMTADTRRYLQGIINEMNEAFQTLVRERRGLSDAVAREIADGRIVTGRRALAMGLIDQLGGEAEARIWLESRGVAANLPVRPVRITREESWWTSLVRSTVQALTGKTYLLERLTLDGPVALWHPADGAN